MLKIKTIVHHESEVFDEGVNTALLEGWTLTKRSVIQVSSTAWKLYAELEKVIITEAEKCCDNCRYYALDSNMEPCRHCNDASHWEPEQ